MKTHVVIQLSDSLLLLGLSDNYMQVDDLFLNHSASRVFCLVQVVLPNDTKLVN